MSTTLQDLSQALAQLVAAADPQIVRVEGRNRLPATGVVYAADGLIVTANHVVERDDDLAVGLADGGSVAATLVGRDPSTDVALLRVQTQGLAPATWTEAAALKVGHIVVAAGRPGKTVQATLGIVSALGGAWRTHGGVEIDHYLQTDVAMYPGFSGGPLLTADGSFAGLNTSALVRGVSVTVPAATIARTVTTLLAHGRVPRPFLGVGIQPVRLSAAMESQAGQETGLMVMSVEAQSPADQGGVKQGDIILALSGKSVRHVDDLQAALAAATLDQPSTLKVVRSDELRELTIVARQAR
jgi:S1-C subfamily serine protease